MREQARNLRSAWTPPCLSCTPQQPITKHIILQSACSTPVQCHLLLASPSGLPIDLQQSKPTPQHDSWGSARSAPYLSPLCTYTHAPAMWHFFQLPNTPISNWTPDLCTCRPPCQVQAFLTWPAAPHPSGLSLHIFPPGILLQPPEAWGPPRNLSGSVCP